MKEEHGLYENLLLKKAGRRFHLSSPAVSSSILNVKEVKVISACYTICLYQSFLIGIHVQVYLLIDLPSVTQHSGI